MPSVSLTINKNLTAALKLKSIFLYTNKHTLKKHNHYSGKLGNDCYCSRTSNSNMHTKEIIMFLQNIKLNKPYVVIEKNRVQLSSTEKVLIKK